MKETPDLSQEFHPVPKVFKVKKPVAKLGAGKKTNASLDAVELLKKQFAAWGITTCEWTHDNCWRNNALTFAHKDKRRNLSPAEVKDPRSVALICTPGHQELEAMPREEMRKIIEQIVEDREHNL